MRALAIDAPGAARVVERARPVPGAGEALVRVRRVGLCGTDLSTFLGKNPLVTYPARDRPRDRRHHRGGRRRRRRLACRCGRDAQPVQALRRLRGMPACEAERVPQQPDARRPARGRARRVRRRVRGPALHVGLAVARSPRAGRAVLHRHARGPACASCPGRRRARDGMRWRRRWSRRGSRGARRGRHRHGRGPGQAGAGHRAWRSTHRHQLRRRGCGPHPRAHRRRRARRGHRSGRQAGDVSARARISSPPAAASSTSAG